MNITREQLGINADGYKQIVASGAFTTLEQYYTNRFLQVGHGQSVEQLGETYLYESGAISVFRMIRELAEGVEETMPELLEEEILEDDTENLLD